MPRTSHGSLILSETLAVSDLVVLHRDHVQRTTGVS